MKILFRAPKSEAELAWIKKQTLESLYYHKDDVSNSWSNKGIRSDIFKREHGQVLDDLLKVSNILMAVDEENDDGWYGFVVWQKSGEEFIFHYVYSKKIFWRQGIATELLKQTGYSKGMPCWYSHSTAKLAKCLPRGQALKGLVYNPYLAFFPVK